MGNKVSKYASIGTHDEPQFNEKGYIGGAVYLTLHHVITCI